MTFRIRDFDPAKDKAAALAFIMGSQQFEHTLEPDRRLDPQVAEDFFPVLMKRVAMNSADASSSPSRMAPPSVGPCFSSNRTFRFFVVTEERTYGPSPSSS